MQYKHVSNRLRRQGIVAIIRYTTSQHIVLCSPKVLNNNLENSMWLYYIYIYIYYTSNKFADLKEQWKLKCQFYLVLLYFLHFVLAHSCDSKEKKSINAHPILDSLILLQMRLKKSYGKQSLSANAGKHTYTQLNVKGELIIFFCLVLITVYSSFYLTL